MCFMSFSDLFVAMETCIEETSLLAGLVKITEMSGLTSFSLMTLPALFLYIPGAATTCSMVECAFCWKKSRCEVIIVAIATALYFFPSIFVLCCH